MTTPCAPTGDHGGLRGAVDGMARVLMAAWEKAEGAPVSVSYVATFADMARAALAAHPVPEPAQDGEVERVLAEHRLVWENDGGDYGGRSWFECTCDADEHINPTEYATVEAHEAHLAAVLVAAGVTRA